VRRTGGSIIQKEGPPSLAFFQAVRHGSVAGPVANDPSPTATGHAARREHLSSLRGLSWAFLSNYTALTPGVKWPTKKVSAAAWQVDGDLLFEGVPGTPLPLWGRTTRTIVRTAAQPHLHHLIIRINRLFTYCVPMPAAKHLEKPAVFAQRQTLLRAIGALCNTKVRSLPE